MSLSKKTIKWLAKKAPISLQGKTVLITGSNSGIGYKMAEVSIYLGAKVIMACRNKAKAQAAIDTLAKDYPDATISFLELDLASLDSIDHFVGEIKDGKIDIDAFVNNAGVYHQPGKTTKDGFELVLGVNYLATYYIAEKILPYLLTLPHDVIYVNTISIAHKSAKKIDYDDFFFSKKYKNFAVYARSKMCLAKYSYYLAQKYKNSNVKVYMNHPGMAITPLAVNSVGTFMGKLSKGLAWMFNSPEKSSLSLAYIMSHDVPVGSIVGPNKLFGGWGYPKINKTIKQVKLDADKLVSFSAEQIKSHHSK